MCKRPKVGMRLVCCNNRKKIQFGQSRVSEGQVEGQGEDREEMGADGVGLVVMGRVLAFASTLHAMEPQSVLVP